jgi:hypothetical protein
MTHHSKIKNQKSYITPKPNHAPHQNRIMHHTKTKKWERDRTDTIADVFASTRPSTQTADTRRCT